MIGNLLLAPIFIHLVIAVLQLTAWRKTITQRILSATGTLAALIAAISLFSYVYKMVPLL